MLDVTFVVLPLKFRTFASSVQGTYLFLKGKSTLLERSHQHERSHRSQITFDLGVLSASLYFGHSGIPTIHERYVR